MDPESPYDSLQSLCFYNSLGVVPNPVVTNIEGFQWVSLNIPDFTIPLDALNLKDSNSYPTDLDHNGILRRLEWARVADWYRSKHHWAAFTPLDSSPPNAWYLDLRNSPIVFDDRNFTYFEIPESWAERARSAILELHNYCALIRQNTSYGMSSPLPVVLDLALLNRLYESDTEAQIVANQARRCVLDHLAFLGWWTRSMSNWTNELEIDIVDAIDRWSPRDRQTRGVLVDLVRDYKEINIRNLVANDVPVAYPWTRAAANDPRFAKLSPAFLLNHLEYAASDHMTIDGPLNQLPDILSLYPGIENYDEFFEDRHAPFEVHAPPSANEKVIDFIVDSMGWKRRRVPSSVELERYKRLYFFGIERDDNIVRRVFWRYRPIKLAMNNSDLQDRMRAKGITTDDWQDDKDDASTVRELYKCRCAPRPGQVFNEFGSQTTPPAEDLRAFSARLDNGLDAAPPLLERLGMIGPSSSPAQSQERSESPGPSRPRNRYSSVRPYPSYTRNSYRPNYRNERYPSQTYRNRSRSFDSRTGRDGLTTDYEGEALRFRSRSPDRNSHGTSRRSRSLSTAPPSSDLEQDDPVEDHAEGLRLAAIRDMKVWGKDFTASGYISAVSQVPSNVSWNTLLLKEGVLYVSVESEVRMRLWANCLPGKFGVEDVLTRAIQHGVPFRIGVLPASLGLFRPTSLMHRDLISSVYYRSGFTARKLEFGAGGFELYGRYVADVLDLLSRPHARALIGLGGPAGGLRNDTEVRSS